MRMKKTGKPDVGLSGDFYSHSLTKSISGVYKWRIKVNYRQFRP